MVFYINNTKITDNEAIKLRDRLINEYPIRNDYSDIREGDIVEFDFDGNHYGPAPCYSNDDNWYSIEGGYTYFLYPTYYDSKVLFNDVSNLIIHRELRTEEPKERGIYITQSGTPLVRLPDSQCTHPWILVNDNWNDNSYAETWEAVVGELGESEFPLRKAKAAAE